MTSFEPLDQIIPESHTYFLNFSVTWNIKSHIWLMPVEFYFSGTCKLTDNMHNYTPSLSYPWIWRYINNELFLVLKKINWNTKTIKQHRTPANKAIKLKFINSQLKRIHSSQIVVFLLHVEVGKAFYLFPLPRWENRSDLIF